MKNWKQIILLGLLLFISTYLTQGQSITKISQRCPTPNTSTFATVQALAIGDILHTPCPTRASIFTGNVDFSGATIIGLGVVTGTGTLNFIPRWTGVSSLGDTPFSWNGAQYLFQNTAQTATFSAVIRPSSTTGFFSAGSTATNLSITQSTNTISNQVAPTTGIWNVTDATNFSAIFNANADTLDILNTTSDNGIQFNSVAGGRLTLGDCSSTINNCINQQYGSGVTTITAAAAITLQDPTGSLTFFNLNTAGEILDVKAQQGMTFDTGGGVFTAGDVSGLANNTVFTLNDGTASMTLRASSGISLLTVPTPAYSTLYLNGSSVLSGTTLTNGQLLIGTTGAAPIAAQISGGAGISITNGAGSISIAQNNAGLGSILSCPLNNTVLANATGTVFTSPGNNATPLTITSEGAVSFPVTREGTIRNLFIRTGTTAKVNTPTTVITVRKNGVATTLTVTMTETTTTTSTDVTHSFAVTAGDLITVSVAVGGAAAVSTSIAAIAFEID